MRRLDALALVPALALSALAPEAPAQRGKSTPPPGMALVEGGRTKIGTDPDEIEQLLEAGGSALGNVAGSLAGETPQHTVDVDDFYLMVNEVTNEQYREFVKATGHRPPQTWGRAAIDAGRQAFLEEEGRLRREAQEQKKPVPERRTFDEAAWWEKNWKDAEWEMPREMAHDPVVYVDYQDAVAYATWAGMRLPTEQEYQRAVRGDTDRDYPWGDEWKPGVCATNEIPRVKGVYAVGSFPDSATEQGIHDLAGNVWEWTQSPYVAFPDYELIEFTIGRGRNKETISAPASFNANERVVVGGSVQTSALAARCTIRRGTIRSQQTAALGFRCAASTRVGEDLAEAIVADLPPALRVQDESGWVEYVPSHALAMDRWHTLGGGTEGASKSMAAPEKEQEEEKEKEKDSGEAKGAASGIPPAGYDVITGYDYVIFVPVDDVYAAGLNDVRKASIEEGLVHLGLLTTDMKIQNPALEAGTYQVAIRGAGEPPKQREEKKEEPKEGEPEEGEQEEGAEPAAPPPPPIQQMLPGIDIEKDNFIFLDRSGAPVAFLPVETIDWGNTTPPTTAFVERTRVETVTKGEKEEEIEIVERWYDHNLFIPGRGGRKGMKVTLPLLFPEGTLEGEWRR